MSWQTIAAIRIAKSDNYSYSFNIIVEHRLDREYNDGLWITRHLRRVESWYESYATRLHPKWAIYSYFDNVDLALEYTDRWAYSPTQSYDHSFYLVKVHI